MSNHWKQSIILETLVITLLISVFQFGCSCHSEYKRFSEGLGFSFEYPNYTGVEKWQKNLTFESTDSISTGLTAPNIIDPEHESPVKVHINVWFIQTTEADQRAQDLVSEYIEWDKKNPDFTNIRQESIIIDKKKGYLVEYTFDTNPDYSEPIGLAIPTHVLYITVPREDKVYAIWIAASENEWNRHEKDIDHIIETFKILQ